MPLHNNLQLPAPCSQADAGRKRAASAPTSRGVAVSGSRYHSCAALFLPHCSGMSRPPRKRRKPLAPDALDFLKGYKNALAQVNRADVSSLRVLSDRPRGTPTKQSASLLYREEPRFHYLRCFLVWLYGHWSSSLANQTSGLTWHHPKCMLEMCKTSTNNPTCHDLPP